jgi:DNA polymerase I-like protein with 3'-5' exonuclease and polymerase domains
MLNYSLCEGCPIQNRYEPVEPKGNMQGRFLVVTDVPRPSNQGRLLPGAQMAIFAEQMQAQGFGKDDFAFTPMCHCPYDPDGYTNKEKTAIHKHCREHFLSVAESKHWDAVVPLGASAVSQVMNKSTKITKVRGFASELEELQSIAFPLLSPGIVAAYPQNGPMFAADVASFAREVSGNTGTGGELGLDHGDYQIVTDLEFLIERDPEIISFDLETTGLRWYQRGCDVRTYRPALHKGKNIFRPRYQILTMQFTVQEGEAYMLVWDHPEAPIAENDKPRLRNQLRRLLCKPERIVVGQNLKSDNVGLWKTEGIRFRIGGDTLMLAAMHDENATEKNLDVLTKIHVPAMAGYADKFNATVNKSRMWEVPLRDLKPYGCGDTDATFRLYHVLEEKIASDDGEWAHYVNVAIPGLNALAAMETEGMFVDQDDALATFKDYMRTEVTRMERELLQAIPRPVKQDEIRKYIAKNPRAKAEDALKLSRQEFLKSVLFHHPQGFRLKPKVFTKTTAKLKDESKREPSTSSKDHLPYFFDECPFTFQLAEYVKDARLLGTNVEGFELKYIVDGKVRPTYSLSKTVTGRTSSEDPNGQNYPKRGARAKVYRKMFVPPPGYYVCEMDLSQAELRIAASLSGDSTMLRIYREGGDIHTETALIVARLTKEQFAALPKDDWVDAAGVKHDGKKTLRTKAKSVNFGFLYGMGWRKFIGFAKTQYGVDFTEQEAKRIRAGFFAKYKRLEPWHNSVREFAMDHKYVRSYSGRVRHLPMIDSHEEYIQQEAIRQAINSPVQEFGSSLGVMALGRMNEEISNEHLKVVGFIHDAIVVYVKKEYLDWGMRTVKTYMQSNPIEEWFGSQIKCPIVADCGFGENLGEIHECEGFSLDKPFDYTKLTDKDGNLLIEVPRQRIPPHCGRLQRSAYTLPTDLEDENAPVVTGHKRARMLRVAVSDAAIRRITRSQKQMVINRRHEQARLEEQRAVRRLTRSS